MLLLCNYVCIDGFSLDRCSTVTAYSDQESLDYILRKNWRTAELSKPITWAVNVIWLMCIYIYVRLLMAFVWTRRTLTRINAWTLSRKPKTTHPTERDKISTPYAWLSTSTSSTHSLPSFLSKHRTLQRSPKSTFLNQSILQCNNSCLMSFKRSLCVW